MRQTAVLRIRLFGRDSRIASRLGVSSSLMGITLRFVPALVLAIAVGGGSVGQGEKGSPIHEQTLFAEDELLQNRVVLSPEVIKLILQTKAAKQGLDFARDSAKSNPAQLFRAAEIHLGRPQEADLLVIGIPPIRGADNGWFWVVRSALKDPKVVLFAGGNSLELTDEKTNGYRDIRTFWSTPSETEECIYRFDGNSTNCGRRVIGRTGKLHEVDSMFARRDATALSLVAQNQACNVVRLPRRADELVYALH